MPKMTDYVREGFNRRRRPWDRTELPEWWDLVVWAGLAGILLVVLLAAMYGQDGSTEDVGAPPRYAIQSLNPYASASSATPTPSAGTAPAGATANGAAGDFAATAAVRIAVTGGGTTVVPAGAQNVALAAAKAQATGDWTAIPSIGGARPSGAPRTPGGSVVGALTVADPAVTGNSQYVFSVTITHGGTAGPFLVRIAVERERSGYAVRSR